MKMNDIPQPSGERPNGTAVLVYEFEINRADLARNGCPMPEDWSLDDLIYADRLGLIYGYECTQIREEAARGDA